MDKSILLQKQVKDNSEDLRSEFLDLKNWEEQMKRKEQELLSERNNQQVLPPIRSKKKKFVTKENKSEDSTRIKSYDYTSWNKFDADKACVELEKEEKSDDSSEETMSKEQLEIDYNRAVVHKQQGNIFVQQKIWNKAIASYSIAIQIFPYDAVFYANRALCYLKQDNLYSAEADCSSAIQLDKNYVKAYHRRATARIGLKQYKEAKQDVEKILVLEPSNKEVQTLLSQVNKQLENSKPVIVPQKEITEDISIEKKIAKKMLNNAKSDKKIIETKEEKDKKKDINVQSTAKPTIPSVTEPKRDPRIPDWLPEKDNVEIVKPIKKPPYLRSKEPLKRIPVQEADLSKSFEETDETLCSKNKHIKLSDADNITHNENVKKSEPEENFIENGTEIPPIPKTAVQFFLNWRKSTSSGFRYRYLKQLSPDSLPYVFQDSMESDIFSDILTTLKTEFLKRQEPIFSYLKELSNIKRFRAFTMFISNSEKQDLKLMFSYCKTSEKISEEELVELQNKYEI